MMNKRSLSDVNFYFITDENIELPPHEQVRKAIEGGVKMVQYRDKSSKARKLYEEAVKIREICDDTLFIVNDRLDIALAVDADGVHLGQEDLPIRAAREIVGEDMIVGVSTHNLEQAKRAEEIADYIGIGPVHRTETKDDTSKKLGIEGVIQIASKVEIPSTAIGGIKEEDLEKLAKGADMVCAISSVTRGDDLSKRVRLFEDKFTRAKRGE
ncbi:MAG: thiamine phosphate synthase [Thermoplasmatota archaeon]